MSIPLHYIHSIHVYCVIEDINKHDDRKEQPLNSLAHSLMVIFTHFPSSSLLPPILLLPSSYHRALSLMIKGFRIMAGKYTRLISQAITVGVTLFIIHEPVGNILKNKILG